MSLVLGRRKEELLNQMNDSLLEMFLQYEKMLELTKMVVETNDREIAINLIEEDSYMDQLQNDLIIDVNTFILKEQPKAMDLRIAMATYAISFDVERLADYLKNIGKYVLKENCVLTDFDKRVIYILQEIEVKMTDLKEIWKNFDHRGARELAKADEKIEKYLKKLEDEIYDEFKKEDANYLALARIYSTSRSLRRTNDHITNICEHISYIKKGQLYHYS